MYTRTHTALYRESASKDGARDYAKEWGGDTHSYTLTHTLSLSHTHTHTHTYTHTYTYMRTQHFTT